jgi:preprotein translocase subunit SecG
MSMQVTILLVIQVIASFSIIALVLLQQGKGADMGSAFGGGASGSLFGATGAANFLSRATKWAAVVFFIATIGLAYLSTLGLKTQNDGLMESFTNGNAVPTMPAVPGAKGSPAVPVGSSVPSVGGASAPASVPVVPTTPIVPAVPK